MNGIEETIESTCSDAEIIAHSDAEGAIRVSKKRCLIAMIIAFALMGFFEGVLPEDSGFLLFSQIAFNVFAALSVVMWCHIDSEQSRFTISFRLSLMLFLLTLIAFPYYISMTRKGAACLKALGKAVLFVVLCIIVYVVTSVIGLIFYNVIYDIRVG